MKEFRQLTTADTAEYHKVLIDGYETIKDYPISFDAIDFTEEESREWIEKYPVYGLYIDGQLVSSITLCMPWVKYSTPDKYPHIAHFVTSPNFKGKGYARETLGYAEKLLINQLKLQLLHWGLHRNILGCPRCMNPLDLSLMTWYNSGGKNIQLCCLKKS